MPKPFSMPGLLLAVPPSQAQAAGAFGCPLAHMAYRVGPGPALLKCSAPAELSGGMLWLSNPLAGPDGGGHGPFCRALEQECQAHGFSGILADWEPPGPEKVPLLQAIAETARRRKWQFFLPEACGSQIAYGRVMISSALSGGSLRHRLTEAMAAFGPERPALAIQLCAADLHLPAPDGQGTPLSAAGLEELIGRHRPSIYYSQDLCARYFTYRAAGGETHFVLFDDGETLGKKLLLAAELGLSPVIAAYPQVGSLLPAALSVLARRR